MQVNQPKQPTITEIIERLQAHLDRFEADKAIRKRLKLNWPIVCRGPADHWVGFSYSYRGRSCKFIKPEKALAYLAWLDTGNVGTHFDYERSGGK